MRACAGAERVGAGVHLPDSDACTRWPQCVGISCVRAWVGVWGGGGGRHSIAIMPSSTSFSKMLSNLRLPIMFASTASASTAIPWPQPQPQHCHNAPRQSTCISTHGRCYTYSAAYCRQYTASHHRGLDPPAQTITAYNPWQPSCRVLNSTDCTNLEHGTAAERQVLHKRQCTD